MNGILWFIFFILLAKHKHTKVAVYSEFRTCKPGIYLAGVDEINLQMHTYHV